MNTRQKGFSLFELMVCLSIVSTLLIMAVPMLQTFVRNQRKTVEVNLLIGALNYTRGEAAMQRRALRLCGGTSEGGCADKPVWAGDLLMVAEKGAGLLQAADAPLMVFPHGGEFVWHWRGAGGLPFIRFNPDGSAAGRNGTFTLCHEGEALHQVVVNFAGRVRSQVPSKGARCD